MMNLHTDKGNFAEIIDSVSQDLGLARDIIEKDYYVTLVMKELFKEEEGLVFKGGTSLSKGYHLLDRFSEDIDLNYIDHDALNRSKRREIKYALNDAVNRCGLSVLNLEDTRSNRDFNRYIIGYDRTYPLSGLQRSEVIVEIAFQERSYPCEKRRINSLIGEYLYSKNAADLIERYDMKDFEVTIQSYIRTFIDKLFALCDYYLLDKITEHSRHLYDTYKIFPLITFDEEFKQLFLQVKEERSKNRFCLSAISDMPLTAMLRTVIDTDIYRKDYESRTATLLKDKTTYEDVIISTKQIIMILEGLGL